MVSRKVLKENLKDSLKLNRERLASQQRRGAESKFADEEDEDGVEQQQRPRLEGGENVRAGANRPGPRPRPGGRAKKGERKTVKLLDYLHSVHEAAEGERDTAVEALGSAGQAPLRRYDWEEDDEENRSLFGGEAEEGISPPPPPPPPPPPSLRTPHLAESPGPLSSAVSSRSSLRTSSSSHSARSRYLATKLELEDKCKTIEALKEALGKVRAEKAAIQKKAAAESGAAMEQQRQDHEKAVARHLSFIDKLLADKKHLAGKVEEMASRLKKSEEAMASKVRTVEAKHAKDLARMRETLAAADAAKRQRWQKEKSQELKELTIKGLEPEVQGILAKHKEDLRVVEDKFKDEARTLRDEHERERVRAVQELRAQHEIDLQEMRSKERASVCSKLRQQEERHQEEMAQQRKRFEAEFADVRARHKQELETAQAHVQSRVTEAVRAKEAELVEQKRRLEVQLETLEKKWAIEKEQWQTKVIRKLEEKAQQEEARMRDRLTAARDKQIDAVIGKLCGEQESKLAELQHEHERALQEAQRRASQEAEDAKAGAEEWKRKYTKLLEAQRADRRTHSSAESRVRELEQQAEARESRIVELSKKVAATTDLLAEREREVRAEYADKQGDHAIEMAGLREQLADLRSQLARANSERKQETARLRAEFEDETEEIHHRVRLTISRKDDTIQALRAQVREMQERVEGYDAILAKRRDELINT